jgi:hypothetical protein
MKATIAPVPMMLGRLPAARPPGIPAKPQRIAKK